MSVMIPPETEASSTRPLFAVELQPFLDLGISSDQAERAVRYLRADGATNGTLASRSRRLAVLANACGSLQNAKLAYSLATRSGGEPDDQGVHLLSVSLSCCDCVPAAVRLWKAAIAAGVTDGSLLETAARLGGDGAETVKLLALLHNQPEKAELVSVLARRLAAPGWCSEGSWGGRPDDERELIWWDYTCPSERVPFGMSLTSEPLKLTGKVGSRFLFESRWEILGVTDRCHLEISKDGGKKWDKLTRYEGTSDGWVQQEIDLQDYDGHTVVLRFHVLSGGQRQGRGFEMASPRIESVPVTYRFHLDFPELSQGWCRRQSEDRGEVLAGHLSESVLESLSQGLPQLERPTLTLEGRLLASSVYAKATIEVVDENGVVGQTLEVPTGSEWRSLRLPLTQTGPVSFRLSARFNQRKDEDGLWVRKMMVQGGEPGRRELLLLDGGGEDGEKERLGLLQLLSCEGVERLHTLLALRRGLPSLQGALALLPLIEKPEHVAVLLNLFSQLKEEAVPSFALLTELANGEDLSLQTKVLLTSGLPYYASTRDHLGDGLVSLEEFEENCRLYLDMRQKWSEETSRCGLGLLMTPVAAEGLADRVATFRELLSQHAHAEDVFSAWESAWELES